MNRRRFCQSLAGAALPSSAMLAQIANMESNSSGRSGTDQEQRNDLELLLRVLPPTLRRPPEHGRINAIDRTWEDWQKRTGELPPKFSAMPSQPFLPNPLEGITSTADWEKRRQEIRGQIEHWMTGRMPPAPDNLRTVVTGEERKGDLTIRDVRLEFGPDHRGTLRLQLLIPAGDGPRPVFLTNQNRTRPWTATAVARGYIGVIYFATDPAYGYGDDSDQYIELYPDYDFSCLARWAWAGSRAVDYLVTLPEVDSTRIAITGHSRNAKQALIAAAFDERIAAVVPSSGNTGECNPWRYTSDPYVTESIEQITTNFSHWFHPRLRFFTGREDKLPFDQNSMIALVAPRSILLSCSYTEEQGSDFGFEINYRALCDIYKYVGAPGHLGLRLRAGPHPTTAGDIEAYVDFLDSVFGRTSTPFAPIADPTFVFGYTFENWKKQSGETATSQPAGDKLQWALGQEPPQVPLPKEKRGMVSAGWIDMLDQRPIQSKVMRAAKLAYGVDLKADLYLPLQHEGKIPLVVWLHPFAYNTGYSRDAKQPFEELTRRGYGVLAFDQIGFGTRVEHAKDFYRRYPKWSMLGKMIADTRAAITAGSTQDEIDASKVYLLGYSLGSQVALWTAALDPRPAAAVAVAGISPLRTSKNIEGIRGYSHLHGLLPHLGFYADNPSDLPLDYDEVFRRIGNRKILLIAPTHDRYTDLEGLRTLVQPFPHLQIQSPDDFNRFPRSTQGLAFDWLDKQRT